MPPMTTNELQRVTLLASRRLESVFSLPAGGLYRISGDLTGIANLSGLFGDCLGVQLD